MDQHNTDSECTCRAAGFCERFQRQMDDSDLANCQRSPEHRSRWAEELTQRLSSHATGEPGIVQKAINLGRAVVKHVRDRGRKLSDPDYEQRLSICRACPSCNLRRMICREKKCGCHLRVKARWRSEMCPLSKWPELPDSADSEQAIEDAQVS